MLGLERRNNSNLSVASNDLIVYGREEGSMQTVCTLGAWFVVCAHSTARQMSLKAEFHIIFDANKMCLNVG